MRVFSIHTLPAVPIPPATTSSLHVMRCAVTFVRYWSECAVSSTRGEYGRVQRGQNTLHKPHDRSTQLPGCICEPLTPTGWKEFATYSATRTSWTMLRIVRRSSRLGTVVQVPLRTGRFRGEIRSRPIHHHPPDYACAEFYHLWPVRLFLRGCLLVCHAARSRRRGSRFATSRASCRRVLAGYTAGRVQ